LVGALPLIQPKIKGIPELAEHLPMLFDGAAPIAEDAMAKLAAQPDLSNRLKVLLTHLDAVTEWTAPGLQTAIAAAAAALSIKPGALMFPLRVLLTGQTHGVDLLPALEWLGKEESMHRGAARARLLVG
jgi:glutamyl-tRNA synthetase